MIIPIDTNTRIVGTKRAWELQRTRKRNGELSWEPHKWFNSFRSALEEAAHHEIRVHPANGLSEAILAVADTVQKHENLISSEYRLAKRINEPDS